MLTFMYSKMVGLFVVGYAIGLCPWRQGFNSCFKCGYAPYNLGHTTTCGIRASYF